MKKTTLLLSILIFGFQSLIYGQARQTNDDENGDWTEQHVTLVNTPEADMIVRSGDIDNLGFGWPAEFDPFSGNSTPSHAYPWTPDTTDVSGTDRIMVVTSYDGNPPHGRDGYTTYTSRPENLPRPILLSYELNGLTVESAALQIFTDDFQAPVWGADYYVTLNGTDAPYIAEIINTLHQTGPIGKIINVIIPENHLYLLERDSLSVFFDDTITGAGDGYAIDFVKLLLNPKGFAYTAKLFGYITDFATGNPIENAIVRASGTSETLSNAEGMYLLEDIPAGLNNLYVTKFSYDTATILVDLKAGDSLQRDFQLNEILDAEFIADATEGYSVPHTVNFTDLTSLDPTEWHWDFGDGETSTEQNPSHDYTSSGSFTVTLTASNETETNTETKIDYINVSLEGIEELSPISGFMINPNPAKTYVTVSFVLNGGNKDVDIKLIDLNGRLILSSQMPDQPAGDVTLIYETHHLKNGIYVLDIQVDADHATQKIEILH